MCKVHNYFIREKNRHFLIFKYTHTHIYIYKIVSNLLVN